MRVLSKIPICSNSIHSASNRFFHNIIVHYISAANIRYLGANGFKAFFLVDGDGTVIIPIRSKPNSRRSSRLVSYSFMEPPPSLAISILPYTKSAVNFLAHELSFFSLKKPLQIQKCVQNRWKSENLCKNSQGTLCYDGGRQAAFSRLFLRNK